MAKYETERVISDIQRLAAEVLGSDASWMGDEPCVEAHLMVLNDLLPQLPNSWHDRDSLINESFGIIGGQACTPLPTGCLDLRGIGLTSARAKFRLFYDYQEFALAQSQMSRTFRGVFSMIGIQQGDDLYVHPAPDSGLSVPARISFVREVPDPDSTGGFILCPRRAYRLSLFMASAHIKVADLEPEQAQMLLQRADMEFSRAVQLQEIKERRDPFVKRAQEQKA